MAKLELDTLNESVSGQYISVSCAGKHPNPDLDLEVTLASNGFIYQVIFQYTKESHFGALFALSDADGKFEDQWTYNLQISTTEFHYVFYFKNEKDAILLSMFRE